MAGPRLSRPREGLARARAILAGRPRRWRHPSRITPPGRCCASSGTSARPWPSCGPPCGPPGRPGPPPARRTRAPPSVSRWSTPAGPAPGWRRSTRRDGRRAVSSGPASCIAARSCCGRWAATPEALGELNRAVATLRREGDSIWAGRALTARALVYLAQGRTRRAAGDLDAAERLFAGTGHELESAYLVHNRAIVAFRTGDLPMALSCLDEAAQRYSALDVPLADLHIDRCAVLLAAGLPRDALTRAEQAIGEFERLRGQTTKKAELLLTAASAALAADQPPVALARAQAARRLFRAQHRERWAAHAGFLVLSARFAQGGGSASLLRAGDQPKGDLDRLGSAEASQAHLLAGRIALRLGEPDKSRRHLGAAARSRFGGPAYSRAAGLAGRGPAGGGGRRSAPAAARLPPGPGPAGRAPAHAGRLERSCGTRPPRPAPSWRSSRSGRHSARDGPAPCCAGVSAGGPPRWPCPRCGLVTTGNWPPSWPPPGMPPAGWPRPRRRGRPVAAVAPAAAGAGRRGPGPGDARPGTRRAAAVAGRSSIRRPLAALDGNQPAQIVSLGAEL